MALAQVELVPPEIDGLGDAQAMPDHKQDQRGVPMSPAPFACGIDQALGLGLGQVLTVANGLVGLATRYFPLFACWGDQSQVRFCLLRVNQQAVR
jgi:hypothetical protein